MTDDPHRDLVRRETAISIAINVAMSGVVFIAMFGTRGNIPIDGWGGFAADFVPQAGAVSFMGSLIPGLLTRRRVRRGEIPAAVGRDGAPVLEHALLAALFAAAGRDVRDDRCRVARHVHGRRGGRAVRCDEGGGGQGPGEPDRSDRQHECLSPHRPTPTSDDDNRIV